MEFNLPKREQYSNKGTFGKVLNIAGSDNYTGAAYLSSVSALKVGCGLVSLCSSAKVISAVSNLSPDITFTPLTDLKNKIDEFDVISIGCGLSTATAQTVLFKSVLSALQDKETPLVIDADGINILAKLKKPILPANTIITPHPKEASRLIKADVKKILDKPVDYAKKISEKYQCTTILKQHSTVVCSKEMEIYINETGNSALAKAGSGDVLTGMVSGFLAQKMSAFEAAKLAVFLHGKTGEIASSMLTEYSTLASDLIKYIPLAIQMMFDEN